MKLVEDHSSVRANARVLEESSNGNEVFETRGRRIPEVVGGFRLCITERITERRSACLSEWSHGRVRAGSIRKPTGGPLENRRFRAPSQHLDWQESRHQRAMQPILLGSFSAMVVLVPRPAHGWHAPTYSTGEDRSRHEGGRYPSLSSSSTKPQ